MCATELVSQRILTDRIKEGAFSAAVPDLQNILTPEIRKAPNLLAFCNGVKTWLYLYV